VTAPDHGPYVERFLGLESRQRISGAALETLAIVAYKQPVTRAAVEAVRGVNSDGAIASLIARGLVEEVGKAPGPGRPGLLGTTMRFLEHFGLKDPADLPPLAGGAPMPATSAVGAME
jgi:segregation and condensation protein B